MAIYKIENLNFTYPGRTAFALKDICFQVKQGEFVNICGKSGSGKSTLLRHLKTILTPYGERSGRVVFEGHELSSVSQREQVSKIGFVMQQPESQLVTDKVWHELAFGLENLGYEQNVIRLRVAEMASFFGIESWFEKNVAELSGGQKQILNLASVMVMQPSVVILDEPTAQLDPISTSDFLELLHKINDEIGTTIILSEHRQDEVFSIAHRVIVMSEGEIVADAHPREIGAMLKQTRNEMYAALPAAVKLFIETDGTGNCSLKISEARAYLSENFNNIQSADVLDGKLTENKAIVEMKNIWFKYNRENEFVLKGLDLKVEKNSIHAIVGGNGAGKTTLLNILGGVLKCQRGQVKFEEKVKTAVLPQNPQALFVGDCVFDDLKEMNADAQEIENVLRQLEILHLAQIHPFDLSGGEQHRAALAKVLLLKPNLLLLDEPTKGMDACFKKKFAEILKKLKQQGITIILVSHDIEFCAKYADECSLIFNGEVVSNGNPKAFFGGNNFYTTSANKMSKHLLENIVTVEELIQICKASF